ncbi:hypothetical protein BDN72DRAFT_812753 [Pluteus cervinus]|uniref:Uncharacterized protein n=1 Tax=Pluteus cervinus TaxID=181527 RepID=A0ACD3BBK9_9AGAR|nr:hypothetical protein BDN72DRAFT_812753 [Pluteus cervinus]
MLPWLLVATLPLTVLADVDKTHGVAPGLLSRYAPTGDKWTCLDGIQVIPWRFVNDDSCDCSDGSDEPGTGACPNTTFYCKNEGHIGASISSSRVRDGLCEPQCCDGTDERPGVCKNTCAEVGALYRKKRDEENKIRKTGSKIRTTYIAFAQKEKKRLEALIESTTQEIEVKEKEVSRLKDIADRLESLSEAALNYKKESQLYISLLDYSDTLRALQNEHKKQLEKQKALGDILDALRTGYNPNYQDMAVLEAVRGWEQIAGLPHINDVGKEDSTTEGENGEEGEAENAEDDELTPEEIETSVNRLLRVDHESLLIAHDEHINAQMDDASHMSSVLPKYEELKDTFVSWMQTLGLVHRDVDPAGETSRARQEFHDAENSLKRAQEDKKSAEKDLKELFDPRHFGSRGQWKKLDGLCLQKEHGDYTYELCFFQEAKQIPKSGSTFSLGKFASWKPSSEADQPDFYETQIYNRGARCWNGPERNVILLLSCGTENALLTVTELEKCEYQFTATTPALCLPLKDSNDNRDREEL